MISEIPLNRQVLNRVSDDAIIAGPWIDGKPSLYGSEDFCYLCFTVLCTQASSGWKTIATLPSGYRPQLRTTFVAMDDTSFAAKEAVVGTDGAFQIWGTTAGHQYWGSVTFVRNPNS